MKPDAYMPFYFTAFWDATAGHSDAVIIAYMRALGHYWVHLSCQGLPNDNDYLRRICQRFDDWDQVKPIVFGQFFKRDHAGLWQQKRAQEEWLKSEAIYKARSIAGRQGGLKTQAKFKSKSQ